MLFRTKGSIGVPSKFMIPAIPLKVTSVYDAIERTDRAVHLFCETICAASTCIAKRAECGSQHDERSESDLMSTPVIHDHQALVHEFLKEAQDFDLGLVSRNLVIVNDMFDDVRNFAGLLQKVPDRGADIVHPEIIAALQLKNDSFASKSGVDLVH